MVLFLVRFVAALAGALLAAALLIASAPPAAERKTAPVPCVEPTPSSFPAPGLVRDGTAHLVSL